VTRIATAAITTIAAAIKTHPQTGISSHLLVLRRDTQAVSAETPIRFAPHRLARHLLCCRASE
jgi:hypothetical protein